jgi:hypothetical protein
MRPLWCLALHGALLAEGLLPVQPSGSSLGRGSEAEEEEEPYDDEEDDQLDDTAFREDLESWPLVGNTSRGQPPCDGCDLTIDFSCPYGRPRSAYYHRIADCLLPSYGLLELARAAEGTVCVLTYSKQPSLLPLLPLLISDMRNARLIDAATDCAQSLPRHAIDPSPVRTKQWQYVHDFPGLKNVVGRHKVDFVANVHALHRDISKIATPPSEPQLVLIYRPRGTRRFAPETRAALGDMLNRVALSTGAAAGARARAGQAKLGFLEYSGQESIKSTFDIFTNAAGVVGYHGAGFANVLFTARPSCVIELTTWTSLEKIRTWRTNKFLAKESPHLSWRILQIELQTLIDANNVKLEQIKSVDWVKELKVIRLLDSDVRNVERILADWLGAHALQAS